MGEFLRYHRGPASRRPCLRDESMGDRPSVVKTFTFDDQRRFAAVSGDRNPMHMDPIAARLTQAGAPVVHGIHLLRWALDVFAGQETSRPMRRIHVRFNKFVYVGETARLKHYTARCWVEVHSRQSASLNRYRTLAIPFNEKARNAGDVTNH